LRDVIAQWVPIVNLWTQLGF